MIVAEARAGLPVEAGEEPVIGWRCWFVLPHELLLRPLVMRGLAWKPRQPLEAVCPEKLHEVPADGCKCGVWAVCHPMMLREIHWTTAPPDGVDPVPGIIVVGQIALWGSVVQYERGWRASHAYPTHLYAFTDDVLVAEGLRERYGVPVAFGPEAERLRRLLPTPSPTTQPNWPSLSAALLALAERLPEPLKAIATEAVSKNEWFLDSHPSRFGGSWEDQVKRDKEALADMKKRLARALARGRYRTDWYGADWKSVLRDKVWNAAKEVMFASTSRRASQGDAAARRRLLWLLIARRWRETQAAYLAVLHAEEAVRRTRNKITGEKLCAATRLMYKGRLGNCRSVLGERLQALADTPTPSYRAWCAMVPR